MKCKGVSAKLAVLRINSKFGRGKKKQALGPNLAGPKSAPERGLLTLG